MYDCNNYNVLFKIRLIILNYIFLLKLKILSYLKFKIKECLLKIKLKYIFLNITCLNISVLETFFSFRLL